MYEMGKDLGSMRNGDAITITQLFVMFTPVNQITLTATITEVGQCHGLAVPVD